MLIKKHFLLKIIDLDKSNINTKFRVITLKEKKTLKFLVGIRENLSNVQ